jgi:hypothetical protein
LSDFIKIKTADELMTKEIEIPKSEINLDFYEINSAIGLLWSSFQPYLVNRLEQLKLLSKDK